MDERVWRRLQDGRRALLYRLLAPWRRRGAGLLQVGLSSGLLPDFFWEAGFDVAALDEDPAVARSSADRTGPRVEHSVGRFDSLPFDDGAFDHVVLAHLNVRRPAVLAEALRVASRGVIVLEWNRLSPGSPGGKAGRNWPWTMAWLARRTCPDCGMTLRSVLPLPLWLSGSRRADADPPESSGAAPEVPSGAERSVPVGEDPATEGGRSGRRRSGGWFELLNRLVMPVPVGVILGLRLEKPTFLLTPVGPVIDAPRAGSYATRAMVSRVREPAGAERR